jgi:hypothetical protein
MRRSIMRRSGGATRGQFLIGVEYHLSMIVALFYI